jgi:hypothetical protein
MQVVLRKFDRGAMQSSTLGRPNGQAKTTSVLAIRSFHRLEMAILTAPKTQVPWFFYGILEITADGIGSGPEFVYQPMAGDVRNFYC